MKNTQSVCYPLARSRDLVIQPSSDELLIYDIASNQAHCLNPTARAVWGLCTGGNSVSSIASRLGNGGGTVPEDLVWAAIDQLSERRLLEDAAPPRFPGESRRQALKRLGAAAVIALPVIATIVAPQSALAGLSCQCVNPGDCVTQSACPSTVNCNLTTGLCTP